MDTLRTSEHELLEAAISQLKRLGITAEIQALEPQGGATRLDAQLHLHWEGGEARYDVEIKRGLRPATLGAVALQLKQLGPNALLVTNHVTPPLAERLREQGIHFVDAAGNAFLSHPSLLIWVKGEKPQQPLESPATGRCFQASGLRVLFALLTVPGLVRQPYRVIAEQAGVAHGSVGWVMAELPQLGYLAKIGGKRRLLQGERLMRQWVEAYARTLRPKLMLRTYRAPTIDWWQDLNLYVPGLDLGGEAAAALLTDIIEPEVLTFYGTKDAMLIFSQYKGLWQQDPRGNVEFLQRFWHFEQELPGLVPTLLVYADLLATGDARCLEAAEALEGEILDRLAG